jgi:hypothetical protein
MRNKNKINLFDTIPQINSEVTRELKEGLIVLGVPRFRNALMQKYFIPRSKSKYLYVHLDAHGTAVWQLIDGKRTVREIVIALSVHFEQEENYEQRISLFLSQLQANHFITLGIAL